MKKTIRVLVPLILVLAIIFCTIWYLFAYDREFTRDFLLSQAHFFERRGHHTVAAWFYNRAYSQAGDSDAIAIELSNQYRAMGNYTKAEYTLSNAIADGGSADLYIALCKLYVEQDKLPDAVTMLGSISNPQIKAQLDDMRPKAPTVTPDPGFYSQYISATVTAESGTLYVSANGQYPSVNGDRYTQPIALASGENTIYALSVADNGLVSPLAVFGYTIGGIIEKVEFHDPAMEAEIRRVLGVSAETALYTNDLWTITEFTVPEDAGTYADLAYLPYLKSLTILDGTSGGLEYLSSMADLNELTVVNTTVSTQEFAAITSLHMLQRLTLNGCSLSSISGLENVTELVYLDMGNNSIRNITPLASLQKLQELYLPHNALTDLSALGSLSALSTIDVSYNSLPSLAPICGIQAITKLNAEHNSIPDLAGLEQLTALTNLSVAHNSITDVSTLSSCTKLSKLNISNNAVTDIAMLNTLTALTDFNFSYNQAAKLPAWPVSCALISIDGSHNSLTSIDELSGLRSLNNVFMDYNEQLSSINALSKCPVLIQVNVYGTKVTNVSALNNQSVIVNYDPTHR